MTEADFVKQLIGSRMEIIEKDTLRIVELEGQLAAERAKSTNLAALLDACEKQLAAERVHQAAAQTVNEGLRVQLSAEREKFENAESLFQATCHALEQQLAAEREKYEGRIRLQSAACDAALDAEREKADRDVRVAQQATAHAQEDVRLVKQQLAVAKIGGWGMTQEPKGKQFQEDQADFIDSKLAQLREQLAAEHQALEHANMRWIETQQQLAAAVEALKGLAHVIPNDERLADMIPELEAAEAVILSYDAALAKLVEEK